MSLLGKILDKARGPAAIPVLPERVGDLLDTFVREHAARNYSWDPLDYSRSGTRIVALPEEQQSLLVRHLVARLPQLSREFSAGTLRGEVKNSGQVYSKLAQRLLRRKLAMTQSELAATIRVVAPKIYRNNFPMPVTGLISVGERIAEAEPIGDDLRSALTELKKGINEYDDAECKKRQRVVRLLDGEPSFKFEGRKDWVRKSRQLTADMPQADRRRWNAILYHASTASASRPSKKWLKTAEPLLDALGKDKFADAAAQCFGFVIEEKPESQPLESRSNSVAMKGLVWMASLSDEVPLIERVHDLGEYAFRKIRYIGATSTKVGNAVIVTLGAAPGIEAISWLTALRGRVKYRQAQALIEKALAKAAEERGYSVDTLEELAVPTFGLGEDGILRRPLGEFTAIVEIGLGGKTAIAWQKADGKMQKTAPKAIKDAYPDALKALRKEAREMSKTWIAQRDRVERQMLRPTSWPLADWRERYIDHPFIQHLARKLVWMAKSGDTEHLVCWHGDALCDPSGTAVEVPADAEVTLFHPIDYEADTVLAWRQFLLRHEITQPFKQAHREIYVVTDAERQTEVYSNRFAGHLLRQHQLAALCRERGWVYSLQGAFDSWNLPTRPLREFAMSVEYYCEALGDDNPTSDMGIYTYVSTDQVRFVDDAGTAVPIEDVPDRLFSEVMRDVDLFVGVCSIGNDPNWVDSGEMPGYNHYWQSYAFGDLSMAAETRREVLANLVPKLKVADRLSIDGRFLVVRGDVRTYRIHIGSGNIIMDPNNQYLCIVQGNETRKGSRKVLLPFEGDGILSLILSKAAMLADDTRIKDSTIRSQIGL